MILRFSALLLVVLLSGLPGVAFAAPLITGITGTLTEGSTVTLAGTGFGSKSVAAPIKWDTFEDGSSGAYLSSVDPSWEIYGTQGKQYSNAVAHSGSLSLRQHVPNGEFFETNYYTYAPPTRDLFVSYWMRIDLVSAVHTILKLTRMGTSALNIYSGTGNTSLSNLQMEHSDTLLCNYWTAGTEEPCSTHWDNDNTFQNPPYGQWMRVDMYKRVSTAGVSDGKIYAKIYGTDLVNGAKEINVSNLMTRAAGETWLLDTVLLGGMDGSPSDHDYYFSLDDVYIDNTPQRIELCDANTWAARTHCETQIPQTTWLDSTVAFALNRGSFANGSSVYLYASDSDGAVNANGFPATIGGTYGTTDTTPPSAPSNLAVQ